VAEATRVAPAGTRPWLRLFDGRFRIGFVLFGGMIALQSSQALDPTKIVYLIGGALSFVGASAAVWSARNSAAVRAAVPWLAASAGLAILIAISFVVARSNGTPIADWLRDAVAYALFASVPIFALDAQASMSRRLLIAMLVIAGVLGGLSWTVEWLHRREILQLPFTRLLFPSPQIPTALYMFAMAYAIRSGRGGWAWVLLGGILLGFFLVTGTRSSLLIVVGPVAMAAFAGWSRIRSSASWVAVHGGVAIAVVIAFQLAVSLGAGTFPGAIVSPGGDTSPSRPPGGGTTPIGSGGPRPEVIGDRFESIGDVVRNPAADPSYRERLAQYEAAWRLFASSPIVGVGPGHPLEWTRVSGVVRDTFTADTPLVLVAKFGLLGLLAFIPFVLAYADTLRRLRVRSSQSVVGLTLVGFAAAAIFGLPLGFLIEDKGTSLALILLLGLAFGEVGRRWALDPSSRDLVAESIAEDDTRRVASRI
jgi:hypothetical protein